MARWSLDEHILFAEDMMMYFMQKFRVDWTPDFSVHFGDEHPRRFTEAMGAVALELAHSRRHERPEEINVFFLSPPTYKPEFRRGYNPEDFLHFCGLLGLCMVGHLRDGQRQQVTGAVLAIAEYLGKIHQDGSFPSWGGWELLVNYADETLQEIKARNYVERMLFAEDMIMYFVRLAGVQWTSAFDIQRFQGLRRRFSEAIGVATLWLAHMPMSAWRFCIRENVLRLARDYHPQDFLQYCGFLALGSIRRVVNGNSDVPNYIIYGINKDLEEFQENGSFLSAGGWDGLEMFARSLLALLLRIENPHCYSCRQRCELELARML